MRVFNGTFDILELQKEHKFPGVTLLLRETISYHNRLHRHTAVIAWSKQRVMLLPLTLYFRKHSFYVWEFNRRIEYFIECGLINIWSKQYRETFLSKRDIGKEPKKLSLIQIEGIFLIQCIFFGICLVVFIIELISLKIRFIRNILSYL